MNKEQIKAELRRSACEDKDPFIEINNIAYCKAWMYLEDDEGVCFLRNEDRRTFFLLVAEAL